MKHLYYFFIAFFIGLLSAFYLFPNTNPLYIAFLMWATVVLLIVLGYQAVKFYNHLFPKQSQQP